MPGPDHPDGPASAKFEVVINGTKYAVHDASVTYEEIVNLAFPGGLDDPNNIFQIDYEGAQGHPESGSLVKGGHVVVHKSGTEFSVIRSVRS